MRLAKVLGVAAVVALVALTGSERVIADDGDVERRIVEFWRRIDALQPNDYISAADLGQWAQNMIARDARARLTVADFRVATAAMQAAIERAGPAAAAAPPAPTPTPGAGAIVLKVGTSVSYTDGWEVSVLRTEPQAPSTFSAPKPGMQFFAIVVRYENRTSVQAHYNALDWKIQDSTGVRRTRAFFIGDRDDELAFGDIAPGSFVQGAVVFEVPIGDTRLSAIYENYGYKLATWQLY